MPRIAKKRKQVTPSVNEIAGELKCASAAGDYLEIRFELVGCSRFQKVGAVVGIRTSMPEMLPTSANKEDIKTAIRKLYNYVESEMEDISDRVVDAVEALADEFDRRKARQ